VIGPVQPTRSAITVAGIPAAWWRLLPRDRVCLGAAPAVRVSWADARVASLGVGDHPTPTTGRR
jgi:hypothetical protein